MYLVQRIIPQQGVRGIPTVPSIDFPSRDRVDENQLGTQAKDVETMDKAYVKEEE